MQRVQGQAEAGNTIVTTAGVSSTNVVEGSFPGAAISVFLTGTNTLASLFGDNGVTPKANPFTAAADGSWFFYAANGRYDITIVGTFGGASVNRSLADILLDDPASQTFTISVVAFSATPTFDVSLADWFQITLTGNVTGPNFANPLKGDIILVEIIQDGAGNHTWAWPVSFLRPPAVVLAANAVTSLWFGYDGANWLHLASGDAASFGSIINVLTGFRINNGAPANQALIGNGTNFVATALSLVSAQFANQGTTVTVLHGNAAGNPSFGAVVLTTDVSGTLPVANGGTGVTAAQGNGTKVQLSTGAATTNAVIKFDANGNSVNSAITDNGTAISASEPFTLTPGKQIFTANGTFTIPTGVTAVKATLIGGGGGGGGATVANNGGGGGAGGTAIKWLTGLTPGNTIAVTIGALGAGGNAVGGGSGGNSTIASGTQVITTVTAFGGGGGNANAAQSAGGAGGVISTNGDINAGGNPGSGCWSNISGAAGGCAIFGGAGTDSNGGNPGVAATANSGSGGGGAGNGANRVGGNGAAGIVIFEWVS